VKGTREAKEEKTRSPIRRRSLRTCSIRGSTSTRGTPTRRRGTFWRSSPIWIPSPIPAPGTPVRSR
jgi:hypothetical protein